MNITTSLECDDPAAPCTCGDCGWRGPASATEAIESLDERLSPGEIVPAGECPECGALAHLDEAAPDLLAQFRALLVAGLDISSCFAAMGEHQAKTDPQAAAYIEAAEKMNCVRDGECEIDGQGGGLVSLGSDAGAYVLAWVWVDDETAGIEAEGDEGDDADEVSA